MSRTVITVRLSKLQYGPKLMSQKWGTHKISSIPIDSVTRRHPPGSIYILFNWLQIQAHFWHPQTNNFRRAGLVSCHDAFVLTPFSITFSKYSCLSMMILRGRPRPRRRLRAPRGTRVRGRCRTRPSCCRQIVPQRFRSPLDKPRASSPSAPEADLSLRSNPQAHRWPLIPRCCLVFLDHFRSSTFLFYACLFIATKKQK